jgi:hypothetical protein
MSDQARIASIEALEGFRSDLIRYMEKARTALEDMTAEVRRTRTWLDSDRSAHWSRELKLRTKRLEQAEQELYSANLTNPQASNALQKLAVSRARHALVEAEEKIRVLRKWRLQFDNRSGPLVRLLDPMFDQVTNRLPGGVHQLGEMIRTLQEYAGITPGSVRSEPGLPVESPPEPPVTPEP